GVPNASPELGSTISPFREGGVIMSESAALKLLLKGIFRPKVMRQLLLDEPYLLILSILSPGILMAMYNNGIFELAVRLWINEKQSIAMIASLLSALALRVSAAETLVAQRIIIDAAATDLLDATCDGFNLHLTYPTALMVLQVVKNRNECDDTLFKAGFPSYNTSVVQIMEKNYLNLLNDAWKDLTWRENYPQHGTHTEQNALSTRYIKPTEKADLKGLYNISPQAFLGRSAQVVKGTASGLSERFNNYFNTKCVNISSFFIRRIFRRLPTFVTFVNSLLVISMLTSVVAVCQAIILDQRKYRREIELMQIEKNEIVCMELYASLQRKLERDFTWDEYIEYLKSVNPQIVQFAQAQMEEYDVRHQ
nr:P3 protein [Potato virus Y]